MNESTDARWLRLWLSAITVLLAVIAIELSVFMSPIESRALAQIPDSGLQRKQMVDAQDRTNSILEGILQHLRTQAVKVKVVSTDKDSKADSTRSAQPAQK
jgi:uncharacterized protein YpmS